VTRLRPCLVHGLDGSSRSKALSSQGPRAFVFSRAALCASTISAAFRRRSRSRVPRLHISIITKDDRIGRKYGIPRFQFLPLTRTSVTVRLMRLECLSWRRSCCKALLTQFTGGLLAWGANSPKSCNDSSIEKILVILPANSVQASTEIADAAIALMSTEIEAD
jgi:hypothetical protein